MKIKEFFSNEKKWCKEAYTRDGSWCLVAAFDRCYSQESKAVQYNLRDKIYSTIERLYPRQFVDAGRLISRFNDLPTTTFKDILAVVNEADV